MKKIKIITAVFIILTLVSVLTPKFNAPKNQNNDLYNQNTPTEAVQPVQASETTPHEPTTPSQQHGYRIQEYNGNIAVFEKGQQKPFRKTEIPVKNLPETDRKELKHGIEVATNEELQALLEDYLS